MLAWLWDYIGYKQLHTCMLEPSQFERFLVSAERILELRKKQWNTMVTKSLHKQIVDVAVEYLLNFPGDIYHQQLDVRYFVGQILWSFYERYPKYILKVPGERHPLGHALKCISSFSDSELVALIPEFGALVSNVPNSDRTLINWEDGTLFGLSKRVLKLLEDDGGEKENGYTINLRKEMACYVNSDETGRLLNDALKLARKIHGNYHPLTWDLTRKLGRFYLVDATHSTHRYWLSQMGCDEIRGVRELYENFLNGALEESKDSFVIAELLREEVVPTMVHFYQDYDDQDNEARKLLWRFTETISSQIYADFFSPFVTTGNRMTQLVNAIFCVSDYGFFSDFNYCSLETAIFAFDKILLLSVEPTGEEKITKWHPMLQRLPVGNINESVPPEWIPGLPGGFEARPFRQPEDNSMVLELPYITYRHFKTSQTYQFGNTYSIYRKGSVDHPVLSKWREDDDKFFGYSRLFFHDCDEHFESFQAEPVPAFVLVESGKGEIEKLVYDKGTGTLVDSTGSNEKESPKQLEEPETLKPLIISHEEPVSGFFKDTPGDIAVVDHQRVANGFNLVSAEWIDWRRFMLHTCPPERQPKLTASDGSPIPILGYIYGTWTEFNLTKKWTSLQVYVVQARFELSTEIETSYTGAKEISQSCHFILNPNDLCKLRETAVPLEEARATCTFLNPSLLRVMILRHKLSISVSYCFGSSGDGFEGVQTDPCSEIDRGLLSEMS